jgi:hypothetical protein
VRHPDPAKTVQLLDALLEFFGPKGEHWTRSRLEDERGRRCLVGAMRAQNCADEAAMFLYDVLPHKYHKPTRQPRHPESYLMWFNDFGGRSFAHVHKLIAKARWMAERAEANSRALEALRADLQHDQQAAHWITPDTYILCPRAPKPWTEPEKLAA